MEFYLVCLIVGLIGGMLVGLIGGGIGPIIVPALILTSPQKSLRPKIENFSFIFASKSIP